MSIVYICKYKRKINIMEITKKTYVSAILKEYGDIAEVMEMFGVKRVGGFGLRKFITKLITVRTAAFVHRVPLNKFLEDLKKAVNAKKKMDKVKTQ
jgi:virulence-associated protein VapD